MGKTIHILLLVFLLLFLFPVKFLVADNDTLDDLNFDDLDLFSNVDIDLDFKNIFKNDGKTEFKVKAIEPLFQNKDSGETIFVQGLIGRFSQFGEYRTGTNLGIGQRLFSEDFSELYGYNLFYDSEIEPGHHRISLGLEYREAEFSLSNNYYKAISNQKTYRDQKEEALDGLDLNINGYTPGIPWIESNLNLAYWKGIKTKNLKRIAVGLIFNITDEISLAIEAEDDNLNKISYVTSFKFHLGRDKPVKPTLYGENQTTIPQDMRNYKLDFVKRSEKMMLESSGKFTVKINRSG